MISNIYQTDPSLSWLITGLNNPGRPEFLLCRRCIEHYVDEQNYNRLDFFITKAIEQKQFVAIDQIFMVLKLPAGTLKERLALYQLIGLKHE